MNPAKITLGLILVCLSPLCSIGALAQQPTDCLPHIPPVDGLWKDDGNGNEVEIIVTPYFSGGSHVRGKIEAKYTKAGKMCKNPDREGKPVPFQTDFDGIYESGLISGDLYYCTYHIPGSGSSGDPKFNTPFTYGVSPAILKLTESKDGMTLKGDFHGQKGVEPISFTRLSKPPPSPDYQLTYTEVGKALFKALHEHGIKIPAALDSEESLTHIMGEGTAHTGWGTVVAVTDPKDNSSAPIVIIFGVSALPPCKTLIVTLLIWERKQGPDGKYFLNKKVGEASGQGDFNHQGLDDAMKAAFDNADVNKYVPPPNPS